MLKTLLFLVFAMPVFTHAAPPDRNPVWSFVFTNGCSLQSEPDGSTWFYSTWSPNYPMLVAKGKLKFIESTTELYSAGESVTLEDNQSAPVQMRTAKAGAIAFFVNDKGVFAVSQWGKSLKLLPASELLGLELPKFMTLTEVRSPETGEVYRGVGIQHKAGVFDESSLFAVNEKMEKYHSTSFLGDAEDWDAYRLSFTSEDQNSMLVFEIAGEKSYSVDYFYEDQWLSDDGWLPFSKLKMHEQFRRLSATVNLKKLIPLTPTNETISKARQTAAKRVITEIFRDAKAQTGRNFPATLQIAPSALPAIIAEIHNPMQPIGGGILEYVQNPEDRDANGFSEPMRKELRKLGRINEYTPFFILVRNERGLYLVLIPPNSAEFIGDAIDGCNMLYL